MDVMLQRHCAKYIYVVPDGLRELMSDISREVLRSQPDQIYTFIADYLDALMITRENARVAARMVESITEIGVTIAELLVRTGMTKEEADKVATIIQIAFRKHLLDKKEAMRAQQQISEVVEEVNIITEIIDQAGITPEQAEEAAVIIQNAYHNFKHRQEKERDLLKGMVDWRVAARSTMRLYRKTGVTYEEANRAATLIKAAYKGYYTRRIMKKLLEESEHVSEEELMKSEEGEELTGYPSYWDRYGHEADEEEYYQDLIEIEKIEKEEAEPPPPEVEETSETIAASIVDNLLKLVIPSSGTSLQLEAGTLAPSEIESEARTPATTEVPPEGGEAPAEEGAPSEAEKVGEEGADAAVQTDEVPSAETAPAPEAGDTPAAEAVEAPAEEAAVPTEVIMSPDAEASGAETDTTDYGDTTTSEPPTTTETDATTTEEP